MNNLVYILDVQVYIWWIHFQKLNYCSGLMYICPFDKYCQFALLRGYKYLPHHQQYMGKSYVLINKTCYQTFGPLLIWQMKNSISVPFLILWVKLSFFSYAYVPFVFTFLSELPVRTLCPFWRCCWPIFIDLKEFFVIRHTALCMCYELQRSSPVLHLSCVLWWFLPCRFLKLFYSWLNQDFKN